MTTITEINKKCSEYLKMFVEKNWCYGMDPLKLYFELLDDMDNTDNLLNWIIDGTFQLDDVWECLDIFKQVTDSYPNNIRLESRSSSEFILLYAKLFFKDAEFAETNTTSRFNINLIDRTIKKLDLECRNTRIKLSNAL